jgi:nicotinamide-nucleotide amidase
MAVAEIITIGTEILLGEIVDSNARYIARVLRDIGVDLYRKTTVGDNSARIAQAVQQALERTDIIITTGGLGPTVDDPTREALATSVGLELEYRPELWEQIRERFKRFGRLPTENNKRQAFIPRGAIIIENPVGTAPAFIIEKDKHAIIALPGVPREMEYLMMEKVLPYLREVYNLHGTIKARIIHTVGVGESQIDDLIGDLEALSNPTVGLAAHSGQVDVRITAKAESEQAADQLIQPIEAIIRERLGTWIYGSDGVTLESVALKNITEKGWTLVVVEAGLNGNLIRRLSTDPSSFLGGEVLTNNPSPEELATFADNFRQDRNAYLSLGVAIYPQDHKQDIYLVLATPDGRQEYHRPYGGPAEYATRWAIYNSLDLLRKL